MIEAVNSALASAGTVKAEVSNASAPKSYASNPERIQEVSPAPYTSTQIRVDNDFDKAVLEFRDTDTGRVVSQVPSKQQLQAYRKTTTDATIEVRDARAAQRAEATKEEAKAANVDA